VNEAELRERIASLEREKRDLDGRVRDLERQNEEYVARHVVLEQQKTNLVHLHAAAQVLGASSDRDQVFQAIREVVANLVGCEELVVFERSDEGATLSRVAAFGVDDVPATLPTERGIIGRTVRSGQAWIRYVDAAGAETELPYEADLSACIPLLSRGRAVGAIAVYRLLPQKNGFERLDEQLFEVLSTHAGRALHATRRASSGAAYTAAAEVPERKGAQ
jgi:GAF domain-containing protein